MRDSGGEKTPARGQFRQHPRHAADLFASLVPILLVPVVMLALMVAAATLSTAGTEDGARAHRNVASDRPYALSVAPNYDGARADAATILTDGRAASDMYWRNGTGLGWTSLTPVTVSISLAEATSVSRIQVQAGAKTSGEIYYPSQILVFGGDGAARFAFLGATGMQQDLESPSAGTLRQFDISFPPREVREIVVVAFARGPYLFLGEIAAFGADGGAPLAGDLSSLDEVRLYATERRRQAIDALPMPEPTGPAITRRWAMPLAEMTGGPGDVAQNGCQAARIEPWPDGPGNEAAVAADAPLLALAGGRDYAAFRIINRTAAPAKVVAVDAGAEQSTLRWHALAHVRALDYSWVPDVVVPFEGGVLPPRSSMIVLAEVEPRSAGEARVAIDIACADQVAHFDMPLRVIAPDRAPPLHGNLWTYLHQPQHLPVARALACEPDFLSRFGISTAVVHPSALLDDGGIRPADLLGRYFRAYRGARRVLLFMDVKTQAWAFRNMPDGEAVQALRAWWGWVQHIAKAEGFKGEIILYPIDEPRPNDVPLLLKTRDLFRQAGITAKAYATVEEKTASALQSLDILQLHRPSAASRDAIKAAELQGYDTRRDAKQLSVNGYYRMQGWQAFDLGLAGIGLWSAWDGSGLGDPGSGWNPFVGTGERDFGMLYASPEGCGWPSRRLIAWRRGLEENRILRSCAHGERAREGTQRARAAIADGSAGAARQALELVSQECRR